MKREVFLEENNGKMSINAESNISVNLKEKQRLLPFDNAAETMSLYELYNRQRNECEKYRLILNVNPYCTNVLFNSITEPVWREGSDDAKCLNFETINADSTGNSTGDEVFPEGTINANNEINAIQAVRDTEYSHPEIGKIVYHCGIDIFNNHILRSEDFLHAYGADENKDVFNTIEDKMIAQDGSVVKERGGRSFRHLGKVERHMYTYDNCVSMPNAYLSKISEENGWYGFTNIGYINIPNGKLSSGKEVSVNRVMNNNKPCEFYDMYPDRSLFSFIPKVNKYRKRLEKNWDYRITYPYYSDIEKFNELNDTPIIEGDRQLNALQCISGETKLTFTNNGIKLIRFKTLFANGLKKGDYVRFYYVTDDALERYFMKVRVQSIGDYEGYDTDKYFSVAYDDIADFITLEEDENGNDEVQPIKVYVRREVSGVEFNYYFRKFRGLDIEPRSEINKTAYQETIYGDKTAQIIYTNDVDVSGLVDNLGRPVSMLYLTIVKTNRGHDEWYNGHNTTGDTIEFSHCFGKVTSGFDLGNDAFDYNIRKLHNIDRDKLNDPTKEMLGWVGVSAMPLTVENDIKIESEEFYGDVACFDPYNYVEYILMPLYHRFNTEQRELISDTFKDLICDEIQSDDFDYLEDEDMGEAEPEDELNTPIISADCKGNRDTGTIELGENELEAKITIGTIPEGFAGTLSLIDEEKCAVLTKNGNVYTVAFAENNSEEKRTVRVVGTLSTLEDIEYDGIATVNINYTFTQGARTDFPHSYKLLMEANPIVLGTDEEGVAKLKIEYVSYFSADNTDESNIKSKKILSDEEALQVGNIVWETPSAKDSFVNSLVCKGKPEGRFEWTGNTNSLEAHYQNSNYTRDTSHPAMDLTGVTLKATLTPGDGTDASEAMVDNIILKGEVVTWSYSLTLTPPTARIYQGFSFEYEATLHTFKNGEEVSAEVVNDKCVWTLTDDSNAYDIEDYAKIENGKVTRIFKDGVAEPTSDINGKVTAKYTLPDETVLSQTVDVVVGPNKKNSVTIKVVDHFPTAATQLSVEVTAFHSTNSEYNQTVGPKTITANSPQAFDFESGPVGELKYVASIKGFTGDTEASGMTKYSPFTGLERKDYITLNEDIKVSPLTEQQINNSEFHFSGGQRTFKIDTSQASGFSSLKLTVDSVVTATTNTVGTKDSPEFYWGALSTAATNTVSISGNVIDSTRYKHFSIVLEDGEGNKIRDVSLEQIRGNNGNFNITGLTRADLSNTDKNKQSVFKLIVGRPTFTLSAYTETDNQIVKYKQNLPYKAVLIYDEYTGKTYEDVTLYDETIWSLSGSGMTVTEFKNYAHISNGEDEDEVKGTVYNTNNTDDTHSGWTIAKYTSTREYREETLNVNVTDDAPLVVSGVQAFSVYVNLRGELDDRSYYMEISSSVTDFFRSVGIDIDGDIAAKESYGNRDNYLIGGYDWFTEFENTKVRKTEDILNKQISLKWTGYTDKVTTFVETSADTKSAVNNGKLYLRWYDTVEDSDGNITHIEKYDRLTPPYAPNNNPEASYTIPTAAFNQGYTTGETKEGNIDIKRFETKYATIDEIEAWRQIRIKMHGLKLGDPISYKVFTRLNGEISENLQTNQSGPQDPGSGGGTMVPSDYYDSIRIVFDSNKYIEKNPSQGSNTYLIGNQSMFEEVENLRVDNLDDFIHGSQITIKYVANEVALHNLPADQPSPSMYLKTVSGSESEYQLVSTYQQTNEFQVTPINVFAYIILEPFNSKINLDFCGLRIGDVGQTYGTSKRKKLKKKGVTTTANIVFGAGNTNNSGATEFKKEMLKYIDSGTFKTISVTLNCVDNDKDKTFYGNLNPEGYFYNPHTPIKIREISKTLSSIEGTVINSDFSDIQFSTEEVETYDPETNTILSGVTVNVLSAVSPTNLNFVQGMEFVFYNKENGDGNKIGRLLTYNDNYEGGGCQISLWLQGIEDDELSTFEQDLSDKKYLMVLKKEWCPKYAIYQPKLRKFIWREPVPFSDLSTDDDLYNMPFANGRFYIHQNINFFLRRQDPQNMFNLQSPETEKYNPLKKFRIIGRDKVDFSDIMLYLDDLSDIC